MFFLKKFLLGFGALFLILLGGAGTQSQSTLLQGGGFCLMGLDKHRARTQQWRVPEKILFGAALLGGSAGAWAGMYVFHHKTRHWYFVVGIPLILAAQLALTVYFTR